MGSKLTDEQLAKIKPIPYEDDDEEQEDDAYAQLSPEQWQKIQRENNGNPIEQLVSEAITPDKDKPKPDALPFDDE